MAEKRDGSGSGRGGGLSTARVRCQSCGDRVVAHPTGRCPMCWMAVDATPVKASPRKRRSEASPRKQRDGVVTFGKALIVVEATFTIITLAYVVASCSKPSRDNP